MNYRQETRISRLLRRLLPGGRQRNLFKSRSRLQRRRVATFVISALGIGAIVLGLFPGHQADANREVPSAANPSKITVSLNLPNTGEPSPLAETASSAAPVVAELPVKTAPPPTVAEPATPEEVAAVEPAKVEPPAAEAAPAPEPKPWHEVTVASGDTLVGIFERQGLDARTMYKVLDLGGAVKTLTKIFPGQTLRFRMDDEGQLAELEYQEDATHNLRVVSTAEGLRAHVEEREYEVRLAHTNGTISDSLYQSAQRAGLSDGLIMELASIFGWDVDFALDIREGDRFALLYEELYLDGQKVKDGEILAAQFVNQGREFQAVRYTDADDHSDYYTPKGLSMHKAFLRAPVDFRRISSGFARERYHPVLGKKRPHRGVDYAAATGTPIWAAGNGKVAFSGWKGGYGNVVVLQHGEKYSTLYGHMSRIAKSIRVGARVRQGQTIGYVGMSGLATGPHLHYEFRLDGVHRNPLTVKLPEALPIDKKYRQDFLAHAQQIMAKLDTYEQRSTIAQNNP